MKYVLNNIVLIIFFIVPLNIHPFSISATLPLNINNKHISEGSLLQINDVLHHVYRSSELDGDHVSNEGVIAIRKSIDGGSTWNDEKIIATGYYDYRNIRSIALNDGRILSFFRIFDAVTYKPKSLNYIISDVNQENWTEPQEIPFEFELSNYNELWVDNPTIHNEEHFLTLHAVGFFQLWKFGIENNAIKDLNLISSYDYRNTPILSRIDEPELVFSADNKLIVLFRDEGFPIQENGSYFFIYSQDLGITFSEPIKANVCNKPYSFSVSPNMINNGEKILIFGSYRSEVGFGGLKSKADGLCIAELHGLTKDSFQIIDDVSRPNPSNHMLYGYPVSTELSENRFLVIFTEAGKRIDGTEDADFYKFIFSKEDNFIKFVSEYDYIEDYFYSSIQDNSIGQINGDPAGKTHNISENYGGYFPNAPFIVEPKSSLSYELKQNIIQTAITSLTDVILSSREIDSSAYIKTSDLNNDGLITLGDVIKLHQKENNLINDDVFRFYLNNDYVDEKIKIENNFHSLSFKPFLIGSTEIELNMNDRANLCSYFVGPKEVLLLEENLFVSSFENLIFNNDYINDLSLESSSESFSIFDNFQIQLNEINFEGNFKKYSVSLTLRSSNCAIKNDYVFIAIRSDLDNDGIDNDADTDIDGDGWSNELDAFSWDYGEYLDTDGDGIGNFSDDDVDGDGIPNEDDDDIDGDNIINTEDEDAYNPYN